MYDNAIQKLHTTLSIDDALLRVLDTKLLGDVHTTTREDWGNLHRMELKDLTNGISEVNKHYVFLLRE